METDKVVARERRIHEYWGVNTVSGAVGHFAICMAFWEYVGIWGAVMSMFRYAHLFLVCVQCLRAQYATHY